MLQRTGRAGLFAVLSAVAAAIISSPARGAGETPSDRKSADEDKKTTGSRSPSDEVRRRIDVVAPPVERGGAPLERRVSEPRVAPGGGARLNEIFSVLLPDGCQYSATVRGTVRTARLGTSEEPKFVPNLVVNAWVTCQNNVELRIVDNSLRDVPMTRAELEQAIELRATLLTESSGRRCVYLPDFFLADSRLASLGVSTLCPTSSPTLASDNQGLGDGSRSGASESRGSADNRAGSEGREAADSKARQGHGSEPASGVAAPAGRRSGGANEPGAPVVNPGSAAVSP